MMKIDEILSRLQEQQPDVCNPDELTDRIMDSLPDLPTEQPKPARRIRLYAASAIAAAASVLLLISLGIVSNNQNDEGNNLVAQTDTTIVSPQTGAKEIETRPQEKKGSKEVVDTVKRVKEILQMSKPPRHYMARQETKAESHAETEVIDASDFAERAMAEENQRFAMEMMAAMNGSLQADFQEMTKEIRQRGERMNQKVEMAINDNEY
jgi:membrane-associated HD superfamily phosphohydrolase